MLPWNTCFPSCEKVRPWDNLGSPLLQVRTELGENEGCEVGGMDCWLMGCRRR